MSELLLIPVPLLVIPPLQGERGPKGTEGDKGNKGEQGMLGEKVQGWGELVQGWELLGWGSRGTDDRAMDRGSRA